MRVYFPHYYTEAHRTEAKVAPLLKAFAALGVDFSDNIRGCTIAFCGSIYSFKRVKGASIPVVHYNWDLYPHMIEHDKTVDWNGYIEHMKTCAEVIVPSACTSRRTQEYCGRPGVIVTAPVQIWDIPQRPAHAPEPKTYALDVMRPYRWDFCHKWPEQCAAAVGIPLVSTRTSLPFDEFRWLVANAKVLVSAVYEASTGGMTLLEGYAHGVPVIVNGSPRHGARDYFGDRAHYFNKATELQQLLQMELGVHEDHREWVAGQHSEAVFAKGIVEVLKRCSI